MSLKMWKITVLNLRTVILSGLVKIVHRGHVWRIWNRPRSLWVAVSPTQATRMLSNLFLAALVTGVMRFPISLKVAKIILLGDTNSLRGRYKRLRSRFFTFRPGCDPGWSENQPNINEISYDMTGNERNPLTFWKFSILVDRFSNHNFCAKWFPISSKVVQTTRLDDANSIQNDAERLRSRFFTYPPRVGPQKVGNLISEIRIFRIFSGWNIVLYYS